MASHGGPKIETSGISVFFDSDNIKSSNKLVYNNNLLNYGTWTVGSGSASGFNQNGDTAENVRLIGTDPFGQQSIIWEARPDATSGPDGGWNTNSVSINQTKMYRFSTWIRRTVLGNGSYYFGLYGYNSAGSNIGVTTRGSTSTNTNYYWRDNSGDEITSTSSWFLLVGHVYPYGSGTGASHPDSGLYNAAGTKIASFTDAVWVNGTTQASHRTYLYYCTNTSTRQQWCQPRIDLCDGKEVPVKELLKNTSNAMNNPFSTVTATIKNQIPVTSSTVGSTKSLQFNNNTHYLALPNSVGYTTSMSVFAWIKINGSPKGGFHIVCGGQECEISISPAGVLRTGVKCGTTRYSIDQGSGLADGKWHMVGFTFSGTTKTAYVDGKSVGTQTTSGTLVSSFANRAIGQFGADTTYALNGELSGFKIYNKALSSSEVKNNYNALRNRFL